MSTSSYHINKQRPDVNYVRVGDFEQPTPVTITTTYIDLAHKCKQCQNTFINEKGYCFAHEWAGKVPKPRHQWKLKRNRDE